MVTLVSIRATRVNNKEYLQVVEYYSVGGVRHTKILKSFGDSTFFNRLQAVQFKVVFQALKTFKQEASVQGLENHSMMINLDFFNREEYS